MEFLARFASPTVAKASAAYSSPTASGERDLPGSGGGPSGPGEYDGGVCLVGSLSLCSTRLRVTGVSVEEWLGRLAKKCV